MKTIKLILFLLITSTTLSAQDKDFSGSSFMSAGLHQIKEHANFGMVFKGPELNYGMAWDFNKVNTRITYEYELGLRILFAREIPALGVYLKPVDFGYMFAIPVENGNLHVGPSLKCEYNYNLYPDLQSGFDYWFTNFSLGINAFYGFNYKTSSFSIEFNSQFIGFTSRQPAYRNPYFYDLGFKHAINHLHQDLTFGFLNKFNTSSFEVLWKSKSNSRITIGYIFKYSGYYKNPEIIMASHNIKFIINKMQK